MNANSAPLDEEAQEAFDENAVAIIGMSGRFPGAGDVHQFWHNLMSEQTSITAFTDDELLARGVDEAVFNAPGYVKSGAFIEDIDQFDPHFFDMNPKEAEITDPQHRVLLECSWDALQNAGYTPQEFDGSIAVYAGVGLNTYLISNLMPNPQVLQSLGMHQLLLGNDKCYSSTRVSYKLDLKGACMSIDTACSTSMVAIITGYKALLGYECDMVLAGAAKVNAADNGYQFEPGGINDPTGQCRAFDADAAGTVFGSGGAMVLLKRYLEAVEDGDQILGIIRGGAINNDGCDKVGFTAPSVTQQAEVIREAFAFAEIEPSTVSYVESHGTGTKLGDPVEVTALSDAFEGVDKQSIGIGSVKPNVGHLESAAGITSLIKVLQAMKHQVIPPSLNVKNPSPVINFPETPFEVVTQAKPWPSTDKAPRRACISSFGMGGTNSHIIIEEPPKAAPRQAIDVSRCEVILVSGKTAKSAQLGAAQLPAWLSQQNSGYRLDDMAYTSLVGRAAFDYRSAVVLNSDQAFNPDNEDKLSPISVGQVKNIEKIAFSMPGQGSQYPGMSADLVKRFSVYDSALKQCYQAFAPHMDGDLMSLLLDTSNDEAAIAALAQTEMAQPAIFMHGFAMAKLLASFGIEADVYFGHSLGEFLAAALSGVMSLKDAAKLVCTRAKLMAGAQPGAMLAVASDKTSVTDMIDGFDLELAAVNSPKNVVVSGTVDEINRLAQDLTTKDIENQLLKTSHAYHCKLMQPLQAAFADALSSVVLGGANKPFISSIQGKVVADTVLCQPDYWVSQLTQTVNFADGCTVLAEQADLVIDLGPSRTVAGLISGNNISNKQGEQMPIVSMSRSARQAQSSDASFLGGLASLWSHGCEVDWAVLYDGRSEGKSDGRDCVKTQLPGYAFDKVRCWVDAPKNVVVTSEPAPVAAPTNSTGEAQDDDAQAQIIALWQELLGAENISESDDFFALGGQSLLATRMLSRVLALTDVEVSLNDFFELPTVANLVDIVTTEQLLMDVDDDDLALMLEEMDE